MSIIKNPCLSLGARGSIGEAVTFARRRKTNIAEKKPELPYFRTLPVQYQRWLYEDYAYLWRQQTAATKQVYATAGTRYHLTGFQYWMKYQLTNLPDIGGMWHLDERAGGVAYDSSRNANHGTIFGCSWAAGIIDGAQSFDGVNDYINCGSGVSLRPPVITIETFIITPPTFTFAGAGTDEYFITRWDTPAGQRVFRLGLTNNHGAPDFVDQLVLILRKFDDTNAAYIGVYIPRLLPATRYPIAFSFSNGTLTFYVNGLPVVLAVTFGALEPNLALSTVPLTLGGRLVAGVINSPLQHVQDHTILYNRVISPDQMLTHSLRRYP